MSKALSVDLRERVVAAGAVGASCRAAAAKLGFDVAGTGPDALGNTAVAELAQWGAMVRASGFKPEA